MPAIAQRSLASPVIDLGSASEPCRFCRQIEQLFGRPSTIQLQRRTWIVPPNKRPRVHGQNTISQASPTNAICLQTLLACVVEEGPRHRPSAGRYRPRPGSSCFSRPAWARRSIAMLGPWVKIRYGLLAATLALGAAALWAQSAAHRCPSKPAPLTTHSPRPRSREGDQQGVSVLDAWADSRGVRLRWPANRRRRNSCPKRARRSPSRRCHPPTSRKATSLWIKGYWGGLGRRSQRLSLGQRRVANAAAKQGNGFRATGG